MLSSHLLILSLNSALHRRRRRRSWSGARPPPLFSKWLRNFHYFVCLSLSSSVGPFPHSSRCVWIFRCVSGFFHYLWLSIFTYLNFSSLFTAVIYISILIVLAVVAQENFIRKKKSNLPSSHHHHHHHFAFASLGFFFRFLSLSFVLESLTCRVSVVSPYSSLSRIVIVILDGTERGSPSSTSKLLNFIISSGWRLPMLL